MLLKQRKQPSRHDIRTKPTEVVFAFGVS